MSREEKNPGITRGCHMKQEFIIFIVFTSLLISPVQGNSATLDDSFTTAYAPVEIERVYGTDYSHEVFDEVSWSSFQNFIIRLTENGSRPVGNPETVGVNNAYARNWIIEELQLVSRGRIEVEVLGEHDSVLGRLPGYLPVDAPALMVGGHYDSVVDAPGANDDGTGIATTLELARVLSRYNWPLDIYFGAWNAEEVGLLGSAEVSQILRNRGVELLAYYNVDMLLVPDPDALMGESVLIAYPEGNYHLGEYWADLTRAMSQNYGQHMIRPVQSTDFSGWHHSDHWPFVQKGYTALFAHESGFDYDTAYHTPQDVWNNPLYDYQVAIEAVKAIGSSIAFTMARAYGKPTSHEISTTVLPGHDKTYSFSITTPTTINVTCRWFGGGTSIALFDANYQLLFHFIEEEASPWKLTQIMNQDVFSEGLYSLQVANLGGRSVGYEIEVSYETDIDGNDLLDSEEFWFDQKYFSMDSDLDTISDAQEMIIGTSRTSNDTDMDAIPDPWEIENGLDPLDPSDANGDPDNDGVLNLVEYEYGINPNSPDSDADTMPDLWEIENGLDPTIDDSLEDPDNDAVTNIREYEEGTDPQFAEFRLERLAMPMFIICSVAAVIIVVYRKVR